MPTIEPYAAPGVYDPPIYAQAVKVTGAQTLLYHRRPGRLYRRGRRRASRRFQGAGARRAAGLKAQVEAGGGTMANIVKVNTYLTDIRHRADYGPIREEFFGKKMPAAHAGRGGGPGAARIPDRDRGGRGAVSGHPRSRVVGRARQRSPRHSTNAVRLRRDPATVHAVMAGRWQRAEWHGLRSRGGVAITRRFNGRRAARLCGACGHASPPQLYKEPEMPKLKTKSGAKKRFGRTATGKIKTQLRATSATG